MSSTERKSLSDTVVIAGLTLMGYNAAFLYELGICMYFHIPIDFIQVSFTSTLFLAAFTYVVILGIGQYSLILSHLLYKHTKLDTSGISRLLGIVIFGCSIFVLLITIYTTLGIYLAALLSLIFTLLLDGAIHQLIAWSNRLGYTRADEEPIQQTQYLRFRTLLATYGLNKITFIFAIPLLMYMVGIYQARTTEKFLSVNDIPYSVVLRKYNEEIIVGIRKHDTLLNKLIIIDRTQKPVSMNLVHTGTLKIEKLK